MADRQVPEDPRPPAPAGGITERVADADRDRTVTLLREHVVEGRLTLDEFSERMGAALEAKTRGELTAVMADLPATSSAPTAVPVTTGTARKTSRWHIAIMSGHSTRGRWRIGGKTNAVAIMGGCDLDLRRAVIEGPEIEITAFAFWGGINVIVPEGFDVELRGFSFMGGRSLRVKDVPIVPGSPRIVVRGFAFMGGVDVKSRPNRSARQLSRSDNTERWAELSYDMSGAALDSADYYMGDIAHQIRRELKAQFKPQRRDERDDTRSGRRAPTSRPADGTVTILFCDMVDYAGMTERLGDQASRRVLHEHHRIVREALGRHDGREISVQGDGFMIAFGGVARAMRCAIDIQRAFQAFVSPEAGEKVAVHIGIHTGDAVEEGDDYLGYTVIVASRLADSAAPGEILVSSLSEQLVQGSGEFVFDGHRETRLKGMARAQLSASLNWAT